MTVKGRSIALNGSESRGVRNPQTLSEEKTYEFDRSVLTPSCQNSLLPNENLNNQIGFLFSSELLAGKIVFLEPILN